MANARSEASPAALASLQRAMVILLPLLGRLVAYSPRLLTRFKRYALLVVSLPGAPCNMRCWQLLTSLQMKETLLSITPLLATRTGSMGRYPG